MASVQQERSITMKGRILLTLNLTSCAWDQRNRGRLLPGQELTCAYIEIRAPHYIRQAELESTWAFERLESNASVCSAAHVTMAQ